MATVLVWLSLTSVFLSSSQGFDLNLCKQRESHWRSNQHNYIYSGLLERGPHRLDWSEARRFCRERCMDLISLESQWEHRLLARKMKVLGISSVWTSGHLCDHQVSDRCFTDSRLQPRIVSAWYWVGSGRRIPPTNSTPPGWSSSPWGNTGAVTEFRRQTDPDSETVAQPDNAEMLLGLARGEEEGCVLVGRDVWEPGVWWDDSSCYNQEEFVCEDNTELLTLAGLNQPIIFG